MFREWLHALWFRLKALVRRQRLEHDLDDELQFHLAMHQQKLVSQGMPPEEARYAARRVLGNTTQARQTSREMWTFPFLETLWQDLRYGLRQLRRNPGFTGVAIFTLALGIGANTAMFSVLNAVLLRPLPFRNPGRLVAIEGIPAVKFNGPHTNAVGWRDWVSKARTLKDLSIYQTGGVNVSGGVQPEYLPAAAVSSNFFHLLGVKPVLGRSFLPSEETQGDDVAIISYDFWRGHFGGEQNVVGKSIDLAGRPFTVVGVMLPGFEFPGATQIWVPAQHSTAVSLFGEQAIVDRQIARLKAGVTPEQARSELLVFLRHLNLWHPASRKPKLSVTQLHLELVKDVRPSLLVLMAAVGLVLLIACGDVANLLMARNAGRAHEITVRAAVGASRARLLRQMLTESVLLALFSGTAGLAVAEGGIRLARTLVAANQLGASGIRLDASVLAFTFAIAVLTGVISGLLPAFGGSKVALSEELKRSPATGSTRGSGLRAALGSVEISLALILLIGAGLLVKSLGELSKVNPGFRSNHLLSARLFLTAPEYKPAERRREFYEQVLGSARKLAGVRQAAFVNSFPMGGGVFSAFSVGIEGSRTPKARNSGKFAMYYSASPDYFRTMGIPLLTGREFNERDNKGSTPVVIISQTAAWQFFHDQDPIGKRITMFDPPKWMTVVGVVGDIRHSSLGEKPWPAMYMPLLQQPPASAFLVLHTAGHVTRADIVRAVDAADRAEPVASVHTVEELLSRSTAEPRFRAEILAIFAGLAVLIAAIGICGVIAFSVSQRTHEIGIRMALGAEKRDVLRMVIGQGLKLALIGVAIGIVGALALTRFLSSLLYGVKPTDPLTFIAVSLLLIAVALVACYIPARRAAKVDPMVALRYE